MWEVMVGGIERNPLFPNSRKITLLVFENNVMIAGVVQAVDGRILDANPKILGMILNPMVNILEKQMGEK